MGKIKLTETANLENCDVPPEGGCSLTAISIYPHRSDQAIYVPSKNAADGVYSLCSEN